MKQLAGVSSKQFMIQMLPEMIERSSQNTPHPRGWSRHHDQVCQTARLQDPIRCTHAGDPKYREGGFPSIAYKPMAKI